jgi:hypothetical protein
MEEVGGSEPWFTDIIAYDTQMKLKAPIKEKAPEGNGVMCNLMLEEAKKGCSKILRSRFVFMLM